jgi:histidinol dehydrogenase
MGYLTRSEIMEQSLRDFGAAVVCDSLERCAQLADLAAPEHLEICTAQPRALLGSIHNAGAVFLGSYTPEPLGDYLAGPDHVLPTSGTARFSSALGVDAFIKKSSFLYYTKEAIENYGQYIVSMAEEEELQAHANAAKVRMP